METLQKASKNTLTKSPPKQLKQYKHDSTYVIGELKDLLQAAHDDKQIITKVQLFAPKPYSKHQFSNWRARYPGIKRIQELSKKIEEVLESHLIYQGLNKNPAFPIFILKNNHGYSDKREVETEHTHVFKVTRGLPTPRKRVQATTTLNTKPTSVSQAVKPPIPLKHS